MDFGREGANLMLTLVGELAAEALAPEWANFLLAATFAS
jgi:hypothetical protein